MRKLYILISLILLFLSACGPSSREKQESMVADSIRTTDSIAVTQQQQQKMQDSVNAPAPVAQPTAPSPVIQHQELHMIKPGTAHPSAPITTPQHTQYMMHNTPPPPPPPPTTLMMESLPDSIIINNKAKNIGEIKHLVKDTMRYGKLDTVELTVSYNCPISIITPDVVTFQHTPTSNIITTTTLLTPTMRARLIDPSGNSFFIVPITDTVQIVEMKDNTYTLWQWMVTPKRGGNQELIFSVDMIVGNNTKSIKTYQDKIYVYISPWTIIWNWISNYWEYITGVVSGLFAIFLAWDQIKKMFKRRRKNE